MTPVTLRKAVAADADICARILADWIIETPWMPRLHTLAEDSAYIGVKIQNGWVTMAATPEAVGFLTLEGDYISSLYVAPGARRSGVGKALLNHAKERANSLSLWTFQANMQARRFYMREGFTETQRTEDENEEKMPDVEYVWSSEGAS